MIPTPTGTTASRTDGYILAFCAALLRRALIVTAFVIAVALGL